MMLVQRIRTQIRSPRPRSGKKQMNTSNDSKEKYANLVISFLDYNNGHRLTSFVTFASLTTRIHQY